jgi:hypothetical protein
VGSFFKIICEGRWGDYSVVVQKYMKHMEVGRLSKKHMEVGQCDAIILGVTKWVITGEHDTKLVG